MPAIRIEDKVKTEKYMDINTVAAQFSEVVNDTGYCAVVALAVVAEIEYEAAYELLKTHGREDREGTNKATLDAALKALGLKQVFVEPREFIKDYRGIHSEVLKNVTTHHPKRFNEVFTDGYKYLFYSNSHVSAIVDGVNHDYTKGTAKRVKTIAAIIPLTSKISEYLKGRGFMK